MTKVEYAEYLLADNQAADSMIVIKQDSDRANSFKKLTIEGDSKILKERSFNVKEIQKFGQQYQKPLYFDNSLIFSIINKANSDL